MKRFAAYNILILLLAGFALWSCRAELKENEQMGDEADFILQVNLSDLKSNGNLNPLTRSEESSDPDYESLANKAEDRHITSLAVFVVDVDDSSIGNYYAPDSSRIVGYRIFIKDSEDGKKYLWKNIHSDTDWHGNVIPDVEITDLGGIYADGRDDTTEPSSVFGHNGISSDSLTANIRYKHSYPVHGDLEKFRIGSYSAFVVANFTESNSMIEYNTISWHVGEIIKYWQQHQNDPDFRGVPASISAPYGEFDGFGTLLKLGRLCLADADIIPSNDIANDKIKSPTYIRSGLATIISTSNVSANLHFGENKFSHSMTRTVSRVTFYLHNYSEVPFLVKQFKLCPNFASAATLLFPSIQTLYWGEFHEKWQGNPLTTTDLAIKPFDPTTVYSETGAREVLFDALTYPASNPNEPLTFEIEVELPGVPDPEEARIIYSPKNVSGDIIPYATLLNELNSNAYWEVGASRLFLFKSHMTVTVSGKTVPQPFIKAISDSQTPLSEMTYTSLQAILEQMNLNAEVEDTEPLGLLWEFTKVAGTYSGSTEPGGNPNGNSLFVVKNVKLNKYLKINGNSQSGVDLLYVSDIASASRFTLFNYNGHSINGVVTVNTNSFAFVSRYNNKDVYLNLLTSSGVRGNVVSLEKWFDGGSHFYAHEITKTIQGGGDNYTKHLIVPIEVMDPKDGIYYPLHSIRHNDHIIINVNVRYNPFTQQFEAGTKPWIISDNHVTFD